MHPSSETCTLSFDAKGTCNVLAHSQTRHIRAHGMFATPHSQYSPASTVLCLVLHGYGAK